MTCPGHRRTAGKLLGVCIGCDAQDNMSRNQPPEIRVEFGAYVCDARRYTPPLDRYGTHRFASQAASAANSDAIDSSARTTSCLTARAANS